jgi:type I restriction enzyme S subunit
LIRSKVIAGEDHLRIAGFSNLPPEWDVIEIGSLLSEDRGISVGVMYPGDHTPFGVPLIGSGDLAANRINRHPEFHISHEKHLEYRRTELKGGELLISLVGEIGQCAVVPDALRGWNVARAVAVLRFKEPREAMFVRCCLLSRPLQHIMQVWANTTVQTTINLKEIRRLPLPWPTPAERRVTAAFCESFDRKLGTNRRTNETLESIARAIFNSWFVDFDPVRAKAEGRRPAGMDAETAALFPASMTRGDGETPTGWKCGKVGDIASSTASPVDPRTLDAETPYIGLEHMPRGRVILDEWGQAGQVMSGKARFQATDVLFGKLRPYFHKVGIAPVSGVCSTDVLAVVPKSDTWLPFVLMHLSSDNLIEHANACSSGTKMPRVRWGDIARFEIPIPPEPLASTYSRLVSPMLRKAASSVLESRTLAQLRDALLPKLLSGELRIRDAEKMVEDHV